jgi:two-component system cell cycle response regulator
MTGKILIVDDLATNRIILKVKMASAFHETIQAADGQTALARARAEKPKLILLDMMLPDMSGTDVCRVLRADPATRHIPIIVITASADRRLRLDALAAGADDFLTKPVDEVTLLARIRSLLRASETEAELRLRAATAQALGLTESGRAMPDAAAPQIALLGEDPGTLMMWRTALAPLMPGAGLDMMTPATALHRAADSAATSHDLYLISAQDSPEAALGVLSDLRARPQSRHAAMALVVPRGARAIGAVALDLGANDVLALPLDPEEVALRLSIQITRKRMADLLRRQMHDGLALAVIDPLTGLYNRRYAMPHLDRIAREAGARGGRYAVMLLDLDRFKTINETFGHGAGDRVLAGVAARLRDNLRPSDLVARIGGEEFLVVLADVGAEIAHRTAHRLCAAIDAAPPADGIPVTASVGLAIGHGPADAQNVLERADRALRLAKSAGRNQVTALDEAA